MNIAALRIVLGRKAKMQPRTLKPLEPACPVPAHIAEEWTGRTRNVRG